MTHHIQPYQDAQHSFIDLVNKNNNNGLIIYLMLKGDLLRYSQKLKYEGGEKQKLISNKLNISHMALMSVY